MIPVWPTWAQFKLGPLLRMEQDKRFYHDLFSPPEDYLSGLRKLEVLWGTPRIAERYLAEWEDAPRRALVVFEGMEHYFRDILEDHALVRSELLRMTRAAHKRGLAVNFGRTISVHVRLGDFSVAPISDASGAASGHVNFRLPISWYVEAVSEIRRGVGEAWPVHVFSDGTDRELEQLLRLPGCSRAGFGSGLADMLALSRAHVLVASGSTFSMWASFLGRMPVVWHPTQIRQRLYYEDADKEEVLAEGKRLSAAFISALNHDAEANNRA